MENTEDKIKKITNMCKRMRKNILDMAINAGSESSHFGGGLLSKEKNNTLSIYRNHIPGLDIQ